MPNSQSGQYSLSDIDQPPAQAGQYSMSDIDKPPKQGFWQATIQSAKDAWTNSQPIRDQEAQVAKNVSGAAKKGDFGTAAEILLNHLGERGAQVAGAAYHGATENIKNAILPQSYNRDLSTEKPLGSPLTPLPGPGGALEEFVGEETAGRAAAPTGPGIVKKIIKGEGVSQEPARESLRNAVNASAGESGASVVQPQSLRESLSAPIDSIESAAKNNYQAMDNATGGKFQPNLDRLNNINNKLRAIAGTDDAKEAELAASKTRLEWQQDALFDEAAGKGVPRDVVDTARAQFKQAQALHDVQSKVFKNPNIIEGNIAHGTPETVKVNEAIKALQKLQDNTEFGAPRLEQALGRDGAKQLLDNLYAAQRMGVSGVRVQNIAKWIGGATIGSGALVKAIEVASK